MARSTTRRARVVALIVTGAVGLSAAACSSGSSSSSTTTGAATSSSSPSPSSSTAAPAAVVALKNINFSPQTVTIKAGQSVEWKWEDAPVSHNVTFSGFASPSQSTGTYVHTFTTPGTYDYRCTFHPGMTGTVVVTAA